MQTALRRLGYYRSDVDGDFGENTQSAIEKYQLSAGEPVTGTLNQGVLSRLGVATRQALLNRLDRRSRSETVDIDRARSH